jgi:hypothetical protein
MFSGCCVRFPNPHRKTCQLAVFDQPLFGREKLVEDAVANQRMAIVPCAISLFLVVGLGMVLSYIMARLLDPLGDRRRPLNS